VDERALQPVTPSPVAVPAPSLATIAQLAAADAPAFARSGNAFAAVVLPLLAVLALAGLSLGTRLLRSRS
jgi:NaMN:DMB phosphoribosyltransferase